MLVSEPVAVFTPLAGHIFGVRARVTQPSLGSFSADKCYVVTVKGDFDLDGTVGVPDFGAFGAAFPTIIQE